MFVIFYEDEDYGHVYWVTRYRETDNYTLDVGDATLFRDVGSAKALIETLQLHEHGVEDIQI